ncbi:MAG: hypothetical protein AAFX05_09315, partial [Planctomycetota bacterium]
MTPLVSHCATIMGLARRLTRVGRRLWLLPLVICSLVVFDAWLPLPAWTRGLMAILLVLWIAWVIMQLVPFLGRRTAALHAARTLEQRLDLRGNTIINAIQLRPLLTSDDRFAASLAARAVEEAHSVLPDAPLHTVIDRRTILRPWLLVVAAGAVLLISAAIAPRVFAAVTPRFVFPLGDHPPFSPTIFAMTTEPQRVLFGDDVTIRLELDGEIPDDVTLVMDDSTGRQQLRLRPIDNAAPPRQYEAHLHTVTSSVNLHATGTTGRSRTLRIEPIPEPQMRSATLTVTPPPYTGLPPRTVEMDINAADRAPVDALLGSTATLRAQTTVTLQGATTSTPRAVADATEDVAHAILKCTATGPTTLTLRPVGPTGLAATEALGVPLRVFADAPPKVILTEPDANHVSMPDDTITVRAIAEDDVALLDTAITWTLRAPDGTVRTQQTIASPQGSPPGRLGEADLTLQPRDIGAAPGDLLEITASATDVAMSTVITPVKTVHIIDDEALQQMRADTLDIDSLTAPYRGLAEALRALAEAATSPEGSAEDARSAALRQAQEILDTPSAVDFEETMRKAVEQVARQVESMNEHGSPDAAIQSQTAAQDAASTLDRPAEQLQL